MHPYRLQTVGETTFTTSTTQYKNNNNNNNDNNNSILYFNVLTQQLQEPITESAQEDKT
jgi:hypothetical protein